MPLNRFAKRENFTRAKASRAPDVALLVETSNLHGRNILEGIVEYSHQHGPWSFHFCELSRGSNPPSWMQSWKGDGIIARIENPRIARIVAAARRPTVDLSATRLIPTAPVVETHDRVISRLAACHLIDSGLKHFGFCGDARYKWSKYRQVFFEEQVREAGFACHSFNPRPSRDLDSEYAAIEKWLQKLEKPVGIMTCYDTRAHHLLAICRSKGIRVPDEVAVVGVDNEPLLCQLTSPGLTSVVLNSKKMGYLAASLLDGMMRGKKIAADVHLVEPTGLAARQSTDILMMDDPLVVRALRFIRQHACDGINVTDVLRELPASRRVLESRFRKLLQRSPHEEILRVRMGRVRELLQETQLPLYRIAEITGFQHVEYLSVAFRRETGLWPSQYRVSKGLPKSSLVS